MNSIVIVLIIYGNLRDHLRQFVLNQNHHRGAFLNANDHKPLGRWPRAVAISREKQYPTKRVRRPQGPKAISMNIFVSVKSLRYIIAK